MEPALVAIAGVNVCGIECNVVPTDSPALNPFAVRVTDSPTLSVGSVGSVAPVESVATTAGAFGVGVGVGLADAVGAAVVVTAGLGVGDGLAEGVGEGVGLGVGLGLGEGDGVGLGVGLGDGDGLGVGDGDGLGVGDGDGDGDGDGVGDGVGPGRLLEAGGYTTCQVPAVGFSNTSTESYCEVVVPVNILISYRFCHSGSVLVFGKSALKSFGVRSFPGSLITGRFALTRALRLLGHADGAGLNTVSTPIASPDQSAGFWPFTGRKTCRLPSLSLAATNLEPTANAANGELMLPLVTTRPSMSVNVIEPTEDGSGSHPGVTDEASPIPATTHTSGTTTSGAMMPARTANRAACQPSRKRRLDSCRRRCPFGEATITSHPKRQSARKVVDWHESWPSCETGSAENAHARRTQGERKEFSYTPRVCRRPRIHRQRRCRPPRWRPGCCTAAIRCGRCRPVPAMTSVVRGRATNMRIKPLHSAAIARIRSLLEFAPVNGNEPAAADAGSGSVTRAPGTVNAQV
jgi:hypothetical protein